MTVIDPHPDHLIRNRPDKQHQNQCRGLPDPLETSCWFTCPRRGCKLPAEHEHEAAGGVSFRSAAVVREMVARMNLDIDPSLRIDITKEVQQNGTPAAAKGDHHALGTATAVPSVADAPLGNAGPILDPKTLAAVVLSLYTTGK